MIACNSGNWTEIEAGLRRKRILLILPGSFIKTRGSLAKTDRESWIYALAVGVYLYCFTRFSHKSYLIFGSLESKYQTRRCNYHVTTSNIMSREGFWPGKP